MQSMVLVAQSFRKRLREYGKIYFIDQSEEESKIASIEKLGGENTNHFTYFSIIIQLRNITQSIFKNYKKIQIPREKKTPDLHTHRSLYVSKCEW